MPLALEAQEDAGFGDQVEVQEVLLDVLVMDDDGNAVVGLGPEDFRVKENGEARTVEQATFYSHRRFLDAALVETLGVDPVPEDRLFVLAFYRPLSADSRTSGIFFRTREAVERASDWVWKQLAPTDWVAVVSYDSRLRVYQSFTRNREAMDAALERIAAGKKPTGQWKSRQAQEVEGAPRLGDLPTGNELRDATTTIYDGLSVVADALEGVPGRKNLVLFGLDFPVRNGGPTATVDTLRYEPMVQSLNDSNVAVYPIALSGRLAQDTLVQLAEDTGGAYAWSFPDFSVPLDRIARESNGYYLLSYQTSHPAGASGYQRVEVEASDPDLEVRARGGYGFGD
ncbi:MAG: VWA domain-containing protein [Acidobacteriota bacterium]